MGDEKAAKQSVDFASAVAGAPGATVDLSLHLGAHRPAAAAAAQLEAQEAAVSLQHPLASEFWRETAAELEVVRELHRRQCDNHAEVSSDCRTMFTVAACSRTAAEAYSVSGQQRIYHANNQTNVKPCERV